MNNYDPRAHGAKCDECPLKGSTVVPPESGPNDLEILAGRAVAVVGEAPGEGEERQHRPFVGPSGEELNKALRGAQLKRSGVHVTNVLLCRPPGNKLKDLMTRINKYNKQQEKLHKEKKKAAEKAGEPPPVNPPDRIASPIDCCAPRFQDEIINYKNFITLGKTALNAVTGITASILAVRGGLTELNATERTPERRVMPTIHPAFCLRMPRWLHVFRNDVHKAGRWFRGEADWVPPNVTYQPDPVTLQNFLARDTIFTFDIETDGIECLTAKMRCIAIGDENDVMVMGFLSKDGQRKFYSDIEEIPIRAILYEFFEDETRVKAGHNAGYYDKIILQQQWGIDPKPIIDTILLHRCVESELPHGLAYVGSMYTEAPAWKTDREGNKLSHDSETDAQLHEYCANDVAVTARVLNPLVGQVRLRAQVSVWQLDQKIQAVCADMHTVGMFVDQDVRLEKEKELLARRFSLLADIRDRLQRPDFNPGSVYQVRDVLFATWKLEPPLDEEDRYTASGDPSTADLVLRSLLTDRSVPDEQREVIKLFRYYRKVQKVLGTYVVKLRPWNMSADLGWDDEDDWVDKETRERYGQVKRGIVDPQTGRMHPGYNAHVAVTGRLSSSKPINAQNFPKLMRGMVIAAPGNILVGADMDQLELRIAAARWDVGLYLRAFEDGKDPHSMTAFAVFGDRFLTAAGLTAGQFSHPGPLVGTSYDEHGKFIGTGEDKKMRDLSKAVQYASQYMATVETVHKLIQKTEVPAKDANGDKMTDGTTDLPYALLPLKKVRKMRDNWLKGAPEFEKGWETEIASYRAHGYTKEPVTERRRDFLDGENPNEIVNFPIQASAAGLMNRAILELAEAIPLNKWGPGTGIINQCHDSIVVECPEDQAEYVASLLEECMNQTHPDLPGVTFTASATTGRTWKEVG
jgi:DNA polymerase I-like protein with 3'-5' exonuclease and polymerase domains/uracil-DNA glycosylase